MQNSGAVALNGTFTGAASGTMSSTTAPSFGQAANGSSDSDSAVGSNVKVVVRCRPPTESERRGGDVGVIGCLNGNEVHVLGAKLKSAQPASNKKVYTFDQSYGALSSQEDVYTKAVQPLVEEVLAGFNCTVFAYGQTGDTHQHNTTRHRASLPRRSTCLRRTVVTSTAQSHPLCPSRCVAVVGVRHGQDVHDGGRADV